MYGMWIHDTLIKLNTNKLGYVILYTYIYNELKN